MSEEKKFSRFYGRKKYIAVGIASAIVLVGGIYSAITYSYSDKFIPGTIIDGLDISGKNIAQAEKEMKSKYKTSEYVVKENGKEVTKITGKELGMEPDFNGYLKDLNNEQNKWSWSISKFTDSQKKSTPNGIVMDENKYKEHFDKVDFNSGKREEPIDAKIEFKDDSEKFAVIPEKVGNTVDINKANNKIKESIKKGITEIEINDCYKQPELKADDKKTNEITEKLNKELDKKITYKISGIDAVVPREAVASWLRYDENGKISIDDEALESYVTLLSEQYSTRGRERDFTGTISGPIKIGGGIYGWSIDIQKESEELKEEFLKSKGDIERVPVVTGVGFDKDNDDIGSHYVEIDLTNQHLWVYKDGEMIFDTAVVTGNPNTGHTTPAGIFYVWSKETNRILRGADYATPVSYWMPIDWTGVGMHDAVWQPSFGGNAYQYRGSHGCINISLGAVAEIYNLVEVGTPVVVHY
ncbi:MAG: L,D-transpeptidase family protein [Andreesenia angusta]|nr:L,D-transpeptidase family protein [Andreesenia angusta]